MSKDTPNRDLMALLKSIEKPGCQSVNVETTDLILPTPIQFGKYTTKDGQEKFNVRVVVLGVDHQCALPTRYLLIAPSLVEIGIIEGAIQLSMVEKQWTIEPRIKMIYRFDAKAEKFIELG